MLSMILIILAAVLVLFVVVVTLQGDRFRIERSATIAAPASIVFSQVNDFRNWNTWSPWIGLDEAMKQTFEGPASGTGAIYLWAGNSKVGTGRMTIIESQPDEQVRIKVEFFKPFPNTNTADFTLKSAGAQTVITWSMYGKKNFLAKAFQMFVSMDKMIGPYFETGLANMKYKIESANDLLRE